MPPLSSGRRRQLIAAFADEDGPDGLAPHGREKVYRSGVKVDAIRVPLERQVFHGNRAAIRTRGAQAAILGRFLCRCRGRRNQDKSAGNTTHERGC
jgi:hypothetical protein